MKIAKVIAPTNRVLLEENEGSRLGKSYQVARDVQLAIQIELTNPTVLVLDTHGKLVKLKLKSHH